ncbi:hypothetical protein DFH08DRAFT_425643, partial [Mycena albidolilacea]
MSRWRRDTHADRHAASARTRHLRDVIIGARHPPGDLKILVLLRALLIPQGAPALHTLALDVAYITDDHEPLDAHPALVLAVVPSLYMLHAELAFRSGFPFQRCREWSLPRSMLSPPRSAPPRRLRRGHRHPTPSHCAPQALCVIGVMGCCS